MAEHGEVVDSHDDRLTCAERPAESRAVQHVGVRVQARVPEDVGRERACTRGRRVRHLDDVELVAQRAHVARSAGARLPERRRV
jgi:hypothetical protein